MLPTPPPFSADRRRPFADPHVAQHVRDSNKVRSLKIGCILGRRPVTICVHKIVPARNQLFQYSAETKASRSIAAVQGWKALRKVRERAGTSQLPAEIYLNRYNEGPY